MMATLVIGQHVTAGGLGDDHMGVLSTLPCLI
jgi:hypothetical protein